MPRFERILVFVPNWVGDVVMATPALLAIRRSFPQARIVHVLRSYVAEVLDGLNAADESVTSPSNSAKWMRQWGELRAMVGTLRQERFDAAVLFTNSFKSALIARLAKAGRRFGYVRDARGWLLTDRLTPKREGRRFVPDPALDYYNRLAEAVGCEPPGTMMRLATTPRDEAAIDQRLGRDGDPRPLVVLNPGANFGPAKCWPAEKFATVADALTERHNARVVASLGPKEGDLAERLRAAARHSLEVFNDPPLGLGPLKALIRRADLLITNDTGPRHFAPAFGVPVVTVFGSSDPAWTEIYYADERRVMLSLDCQPCMQRTCPLGHHNCMNQLGIEPVLAAAEELLRMRLKIASNDPPTFAKAGA